MSVAKVFLNRVPNTVIVRRKYDVMMTRNPTASLIILPRVIVSLEIELMTKKYEKNLNHEMTSTTII